MSDFLRPEADELLGRYATSLRELSKVLLGQSTRPALMAGGAAAQMVHWVESARPSLREGWALAPFASLRVLFEAGVGLLFLLDGDREARTDEYFQDAARSMPEYLDWANKLDERLIDQSLLKKLNTLHRNKTSKPGYPTGRRGRGVKGRIKALSDLEFQRELNSIYVHTFVSTSQYLHGGVSGTQSLLRVADGQIVGCNTDPGAAYMTEAIVGICDICHLVLRGAARFEPACKIVFDQAPAHSVEEMDRILGRTE